MQPGTQLGHYEILSALGKGGMGEVWRARDATLGREVAIKTLPEEFAKDEERLARFEREAKLLASLNHPNIATIHGLEEDNGTRFLVLELVEGDTLADRLKRGAIPVEESLKLALQIAEALEAAHEKGVIHRDLKPANIKVTPDGKIKVLDFGLAKALMGDGADASLSHSPTISMAATQQGVILGTAAYMSPEQARGETTNKRADIWAFGCVLFEMLTGRQTWDGRTVTDVIAGLVAREPEWNSLLPNLHPRLRLVLERCLEKESKDRGHDIADVRVDIQKVLADSTGVLRVVFAAPCRGCPGTTATEPVMGCDRGHVDGDRCFLGRLDRDAPGTARTGYRHPPPTGRRRYQQHPWDGLVSGRDPTGLRGHRGRCSAAFLVGAQSDGSRPDKEHVGCAVSVFLP